ncbi:hypothetical protein [Arthrobacter sp. GMC3]|uniref:hypothetical protein n=1 Tax=Arthrobacter sp. GMC3 TaxID=2058894 RepID=UPI000CE55881|nr:hypothetical protein [Arthrobacter sp. GMC3]
MEPITKAATKRHKLTSAGMITGIIGVALFLLPIITGQLRSPIMLFLGIILGVLAIAVGLALMIAGWMIRMRQAAEMR